MATKVEIFEQICTLVEEGAAPTAVSTEVHDMLRARYFDWIDTKKEGMDRSPMDVWDGGEGKALQGRFRAIGRSAAKKCKDKNKDTVESTDSLDASLQIEAESDCPLCPPPGS